MKTSHLTHRDIIDAIAVEKITLEICSSIGAVTPELLYNQEPEWYWPKILEITE